MTPATKKSFKVLTCTETFKGTLEAADVGKVCLDTVSNYQEVLARTDLVLSTKNLPLSDGGAGFLSAMKKALPELQLKYVEVQGPNKTVGKVKAFYGVGTSSQEEIGEGEKEGGGDKRTRFLVIEMAAACGLPFIPDESKRDPLAASSIGLGELIVEALKMEQGAVNRIYLGLGGTATNDGGIPALVSLGAIKVKKMAESASAPSVLSGSDLADIQEIELVPDVLDRFAVGHSDGAKSVEVVLVTDVNNPLLGSNGATEIFGPQKGATTPEIRSRLEAGLANCAQLVQSEIDKMIPSDSTSDSKRSIIELSGGGAAGGAGCFLSSVLSRCKILPGAEAFAQIVGLRAEVEKADLVITGEGSFDSQTLENGKTIDHVRQLCFEAKKPLLVVCGRNLVPETQWADRSRSTIFAVLPLTPSFSVERAMAKTAECLSQTIVDSWSVITSAVPLLKKEE